jgi:predicted nucleic acid-binding protein
MALTPGSPVFLDTNILIYASFPSAQLHDAARLRLKEFEIEGAVFWTSRQVLREFIAVTTRLGVVIPQPTPETVSQSVRQFEAEFEIADEDASVTAILLELVTTRKVQGKQVHDANIAATMRRWGIPWLLTPLADFTRFAPEISILPLVR